MSITMLCYILFHHQTTTVAACRGSFPGCVIFSLSPNHNGQELDCRMLEVALYPLSSPNHNKEFKLGKVNALRYILFHHQTTTMHIFSPLCPCCVISSFITKPQLFARFALIFMCCVISSFITKPQPSAGWYFFFCVALYPLSSPNHNFRNESVCCYQLRYILFHHQTTTLLLLVPLRLVLRYILFHHQTTTMQVLQPIARSCVISSFITKPQPLD